MKIFFFNPINNNPLIILLLKIKSVEEEQHLESIAYDIFSILLEEEYITKESILVFSIIKDYNQTTCNLILPTIYSDKDIVEKYYENTKLLNTIIVEIIKNTDCNFYFGIKKNKLIVYDKQINLMAFANYFD